MTTTILCLFSFSLGLYVGVTIMDYYRQRMRARVHALEAALHSQRMGWLIDAVNEQEGGDAG